MSQSTPSNRHALWMLLLGNFIIGTGILLPAGLLNDLQCRFFDRRLKSWMMMFVGGLVVGIGAPIFAAMTSRIERRHFLRQPYCFMRWPLCCGICPQF